MKQAFSRIALVCSTAAMASAAYAADWSSTDVQYRYGTQYNDNGSSGGPKFSKDMIQVSNVSGFGSGLGRTYFFLSMYKSDSKDGGSADLYSEGDVYWSLSKLLGKPVAFGPVKDVLLTTGYNYGAKNNTFGANTRVLLYGLSYEFNAPGFTYLALDTTVYRDTGVYSGFGGGDLCGRHASTYQVTPYWKLPFSIGGARFVFDGFMDIIGGRGTCAQQILAEPQLKLDLGDLWGNKDKFFIGIEYQYWKNKFGTKGQSERVPQLVLQWVL